MVNSIKNDYKDFRSALVDWRKGLKGAYRLLQCQNCMNEEVIERSGDYGRLNYLECPQCMRIYIVENGTNIVEMWVGIRVNRDKEMNIINMKEVAQFKEFRQYYRGD